MERGKEGGKKEYQPLIIPKLSWDKKNISETYGELVAQPLEPGFGNTLGNAIRRALLGAVEGSAVTSVIIKGINNEFSSIPGVVEDAMQLILNIKGIVVKNKTTMKFIIFIMVSPPYSLMILVSSKAQRDLRILSIDWQLAINRLW